MDRDWNVSRITREKKTTAWKQLGTIGLGQSLRRIWLLSLGRTRRRTRPGGRAVTSPCSATAAAAARRGGLQHLQPDRPQRLPRQHKDWASGVARFGERGRPGVLGGDEPDGRLRRGQSRGDPSPGDASCRRPDHRGRREPSQLRLAKNILDAQVVVHRKGATPAGQGVLGVIPGSMADPAYVVRGCGEPSSLHSASHGAGRRMSRRQANRHISFQSRSAKNWHQRGDRGACRPARTKFPGSTKTSAR